jgi:DNA-binding LacI/PurR family transcriptional regulator
MHAAGLRTSAHVVGDWSARSGYELGQEIARHRELTAVFCANDQMALGLLRALSESGLRVPDDVSVVGFDDIPRRRTSSRRSPRCARTSRPWATGPSRSSRPRSPATRRRSG